MRYILLIGSILFMVQQSFGIDYSTPKDLPTIEALIECHKEMKKNEKASLTQVTTVTAEQEITTDISQKISDIKTTINKKMSDVNSYIIFATTIANTTIHLEDLIKEYEAFITKIGPIVIKKPYTTNVYYNAQKKIYNAIDMLRKNIAGLTASQLNILKASMDEKFKLLYLIDGTISQMRYTISTSANYIKYASMEEVLIRTANDLFPKYYQSTLVRKLGQQWKKPTTL